MINLIARSSTKDWVTLEVDEFKIETKNDQKITFWKGEIKKVEGCHLIRYI